MKSPLREMSRPKALGLAGLAAGALTVSAAAAALNVGLLTSDPAPAFAPTPVAQTGDVAQATTTTEAPLEIVYQDVYETVPAGGTATPGTAPAPTAPAVSSQSSSDDGAGFDDSMDDDSGEEIEDHESEDHESEDRESEDHESGDHESEDDSHDD